MSDIQSCGRCGAEMLEETAGGLCPRCLMALNFDSRTMPEEEAPPKTTPLTPEEMKESFPQFEVLECLGRGGMGVVYKARQKTLDRLVAIKVLAGEWQGEAGFSERFEKEAKILAQMSHPNIVTVHDFGETGGLFYIVMEFIDGVNLRDLLRDGKLEPEQALAIVPPVCDALQYAHDKGIVHRDIKPENLLLDRDGRIKIADFGIAALVGAGGENIGTPPYMAPEQSGNTRQVDSRADIYALGVVFYEMLTGERPAKDIIAPSRKVQIDVRLDEMVMRALEKEPERRYQTAGEFRTILETISDAEQKKPTSPVSTAADALAPKWLYQLLAALAIAILLIVFKDPLFGLNPIMAPFVLGLPLGAAWVVFRPRKMSRQAGKAQPMEGLQTPSFSRTAISGAIICGISLFLLSLPPIVAKALSPVALASSKLTLLTTFFGLLPLPIIATCLGWWAVSQIRRSGGAQCGMWLAVFDGLLFPLLALDALLMVPFGLVGRLYQRGTFHAVGYPEFASIPLWLVLAYLGAVALTDIFIIRAVWHTVNEPLNGPQVGAGVPSAEPSRGRATRKTIAIGYVVLVVVFLQMMVVWNASSKREEERQQQARGVLQMELGNKLAELLGNSRQKIGYSHLTFDFAVDAPRIGVKFGGLHSRVGGTQDGAPRPLHGDLRLNFMPPDSWQVSGTGDLAEINTVLQTAAPGFVWWSEFRLFKQQEPGGQSVLSASFDPVIELTLPMDEKGLTDLLDPDTGAISAAPYPPNATQAIADLLSKSGLVIRRDEQKNETVLIGMNGVLAQESRADQWDELTNHQALDTLRKNYMSRGGMLGAVAHGSPPQTFLFRSAAGKIGVLQITGLAESPRSVKLRYKLAQTPAATAAFPPRYKQRQDPPIPPAYKSRHNTETAPPAESKNTARQFSFGPVMERVIPPPAPGAACVLDFETGDLLTPPDDLAEKLAKGMADIGEESQAWLRNQGADAILNPPAISLRLFEGAANTSNPGNRGVLQFEEWTPGLVIGNWSDSQEAQQRFNNSGRSFFATPAVSPDAVAFITGAGTMGVLEVFGTSVNPPGVKIRYKLVQKPNGHSPSAGVKPPVSQPLKAPLDEAALERLYTANRELIKLEQKLQAGEAPRAEYDRAKITRDITAAELNGDVAEILSRKLELADFDLDLASKKLAAGQLTQSEYNQAKLVRDSEESRYKLVALPQGQPFPNAAETHGSFGPVMELAVPKPAAGVACLLDFESGKLLAPPADLVPKFLLDRADIGGSDAIRLRGTGADAVVDRTGTTLVLFDAYNYGVRDGDGSDRRFDEFTPADVVKAMHGVIRSMREVAINDRKPFQMDASTEGAAAFITREGTLGVMQILGQSADPCGVRILYKLVRNNGATHDTASPPQINNH